MMEENFSEKLVGEFQDALHRPLTEEEMNFLYWVGDENTTKTMTNAREKRNEWTETFV